MATTRFTLSGTADWISVQLSNGAFLLDSAGLNFGGGYAPCQGVQISGGTAVIRKKQYDNTAVSLTLDVECSGDRLQGTFAHGICGGARVASSSDYREDDNMNIGGDIPVAFSIAI
ncbi:hypothetical protein [Burkholderia ubonensis]|uniref:hypothetical protein n=1 Tax=Burkholderia ubonensis TaxID=101571 RepID=UPI000ABEBC71|nr:hypothetical protein [Burkholderia ubonensis]